MELYLFQTGWEVREKGREGTGCSEPLVVCGQLGALL